MISMEESEMVFGGFEEKNLFKMEASGLHKSFGSGIRTVEFVLLRQKDQIWFVEAKKSCPNRENRFETEEKTKKFEEFYTEVPEKFSDSLQMFLNIVLKRERDMRGVGSALRDM